MRNSTLRIGDIGPVTEAHVEFGDLTVFVGPQARRLAQSGIRLSGILTLT